MDRVELNNLYDLYKELLTNREKEIFKYYFEEDYSLGEIANDLNISRTAVHNSLKNIEDKLKMYEEKLHLLTKEKLLRSILEKEQDRSIIEEIKKIIEL